MIPEGVPVLANAIGLLYLDGVFELIFLNLIISWTEKRILLSKGFETTFGKILLANFVSVLMGYHLIPYLTWFNLGFPNWLMSHDVLNGISFWEFLFKANSAVLITLVVEYPFFKWALKDKSQKRILLRPFIITNLITSAMIIGLFSITVFAM